MASQCIADVWPRAKETEISAAHMAQERLYSLPHFSIIHKKTDNTERWQGIIAEDNFTFVWFLIPGRTSVFCVRFQRILCPSKTATDCSLISRLSPKQFISPNKNAIWLFISLYITYTPILSAWAGCSSRSVCLFVVPSILRSAEATRPIWVFNKFERSLYSFYFFHLYIILLLLFY